jgi:hypothetical protein
MTDPGEHSGEIAVEPWDAHNQALVANVHPEDWANPEPAGRYNLVVIGAGTAGLVTAAGAAGLGARVALVERGLMGGDCLNVGCVPSKGLIRAGRGLLPDSGSHPEREHERSETCTAVPPPGRKAVSINRFGQHWCSRYLFLNAIDGVAIRVSGNEDDRGLAYLIKPPSDLNPFTPSFEINVH